MRDNGQNGLSLSLSWMRVKDKVVIPKFGALFQHFNPALQKRIRLITDFVFPPHLDILKHFFLFKLSTIILWNNSEDVYLSFQKNNFLFISKWKKKKKNDTTKLVREQQISFAFQTANQSQIRKYTKVYFSENQI